MTKLKRNIVALLTTDIGFNKEHIPELQKISLAFETNGWFYSENTERTGIIDNQLNILKNNRVWKIKKDQWFVNGDTKFINEHLKEYIENISGKHKIDLYTEYHISEAEFFKKDSELNPETISKISTLSMYALEKGIAYDIKNNLPTELISKVKQMRTNYYKILCS